MKSKVFFLPINRIEELDTLISQTGIFNPFGKNQKIALKLHFGSMTHENTIPYRYLSGIINMLVQKGCAPFVTDTNVLYRDDRATTATHLQVVSKNGYDKLGVPVVIAGGDKGDDETAIKAKSNYYREFFIARQYTEIDGMIAMTHFKGHGLAAIGGTIKNLGMGCASRKGKFAMHARINPKIKTARCVGCGLCAENCPAQAISMVQKIAIIDERKCFGCAQCVHTCPQDAIKIPWSSVSPREFQEKIAEYGNCVRNLFGNRFYCVNFLINITPLCDCETNPGEKIAPDIGVLFSKDPVAIDRACVDMIAQTATGAIGKGIEKFSYIRPGNYPYFQLDYAEKIGLGTNNYELVTL